MLQARAAGLRAKHAATCPLQLGDLEARFWTKVTIIDDATSCWEWTRGRHPEPDNYGTFRWVNPVTGANEVVNASRAALFLVTGKVPDQGCHTCDNPPCCRPDHLYDGTHQANMRDRMTRGRYTVQPRLLDQSGVKNLGAKLTDELVIAARNFARDGLILREIHARIESPASETVLRWAITGHTWKHLDAACPPVNKGQGGSSLKGKKIPRRNSH